MPQWIRLDGNEFFVDDSDVDEIRQYVWDTNHYGEPVTHKGRILTLGRMLLGNPTAQVKFKDGRSSNYTRENLIDARDGKPLPRLKLGRSNHTGFKGVTYDQARGRFRAQIPHKTRMITLGRFQYAEDAARAYDRKALELYGPEAILNFPEEECTGVLSSIHGQRSGSLQLQ